MAFNTKVHQRERKSGRIISSDPYRKIMKQVEGIGTVEMYERPVGSGMFYGPDGKLDEKMSEDGIKREAKLAADEAKRQAEARKTPEEKHRDAVEAAKKLLADEEAKSKVADKSKQELPKGGK